MKAVTGDPKVDRVISAAAGFAGDVPYRIVRDPENKTIHKVLDDLIDVAENTPPVAQRYEFSQIVGALLLDVTNQIEKRIETRLPAEILMSGLATTSNPEGKENK